MRYTTVIHPIELPAMPSHVQWSGVNPLLSTAECDWLISLAEARGFEDASVGSPTDHRVDLAVRCVQMAPVEGDGAAWLYDRIAQRVGDANKQYYGFDLTGLIEPVQFLKYTEGKDDRPNGHYSWHVDFGDGAMGSRKLSMVVQLSSSADYDGGDFEFVSDRGHQKLNYRERGSAWMFPSWSPHMVSAITRGVRYSLVCWVHGPRFR